MVRSIWLVRHGIRLNFEDRNWQYSAKRRHDSPLSANGIVQAKETALFLKHAGITHIFASPFLRALQTADIIAGELQLGVHIEYGIEEWLNQRWFEAMPDIITRSEAIQQFSTIVDDYRSYVTPVYPEADQTVVNERVKEALDSIMADYDGSILIVAHQCSIRQAAIALTGTEEGLNVRMCAVNHCEFDEDSGKWGLVYSGADHLSVDEEHVRLRAAESRR